MSLNDPQWGKRGGGNEGPPDLDEMWRNFNQKLNGLFGRRRGGGGDPGEPPSVRKLSGGAGLIALAVLVAWLASGFYIVVEGQRGVVLTFGKFSEVTNSGLRWRVPYPFQSNEIVDLTGRRTVEVGYRNNVKTKVLRESLMLTDDENIIDIQFAVQYILKDPMDYLFNNRRPEDTVLQAAETAIREIVGKSKMDFVLYEGREQIAVQAQRRRSTMRCAPSRIWSVRRTRAKRTTTMSCPRREEPLRVFSRRPTAIAAVSSPTRKAKLRASDKSSSSTTRRLR